MARFPIILGATPVAPGLARPLLAKHGLGRLPGDIYIEPEDLAIVIPLTSGLIASLAISLVAGFVLWHVGK